MMNGPKKSDPAKVAVKSMNKAAPEAAAEKRWNVYVK